MRKEDIPRKTEKKGHRERRRETKRERQRLRKIDKEKMCETVKHMRAR